MTHISYEILIAWLFMGLANSYLAKKTGRNPRLWFLLGVLLGIFGLLFLFFSSKKAPIKTEHKKPESTELYSVFDADKLWYHVEAGSEKTTGPMSGSALEKALLEGRVSLETYVWTEGMEKWEKVKTILKNS